MFGLQDCCSISFTLVFGDSAFLLVMSITNEKGVLHTD